MNGNVQFTNVGEVWVRMEPAAGSSMIDVNGEMRQVNRVAIQWTLDGISGTHRQCLLDASQFAEVAGEQSALKVVDGLWLYKARSANNDLKLTQLSFGHVVNRPEGYTKKEFEFGAIWTFDIGGQPIWYSGGHHWLNEPIGDINLLKTQITYPINFIEDGHLPNYCSSTAPNMECGGTDGNK